MFGKLRQKLLKDKTFRTNIIVAVGIVGIALIFLSGLDFSSGKAEGNTSAGPESSGSAEEYRKAKEKDLSEILSAISGCGSVEVMISVEGTQEYVYLEKTESKTDTSGEEQSTDYKSEPFLSKSSPVLSKVVNPRITGVLIVAQGAGDPVLDEKLIKAAAAALGISTANICVAKRIGG